MYITNGNKFVIYFLILFNLKELKMTITVMQVRGFCFVYG